MQTLVSSKIFQNIVNKKSYSIQTLNFLYQKRLKSDALIISAYQNKNRNFKLNLTNELEDEDVHKELIKRLKASHFEGKKFEMRSLYGFSDINEKVPDIIQVVGLGEEHKVNADINRRAVSSFFINKIFNNILYFIK